MSDVRLDAQAAAVASRISVIDRDLDDLELKVQGYIAQGLRFGGALNQAQRAADDEQRDRLLRQRAELVEQLKRLTTRN